MEITFKYNGKVITTPNLEKKLKRMKISIEDIEIIDTLSEKKKDEFKWEFEGLKEWKYYKHPNESIIHCCLINIGTNPSKEFLFRSSNFNDEYLNDLEEIKNPF